MSECVCIPGQGCQALGLPADRVDKPPPPHSRRSPTSRRDPGQGLTEYIPPEEGRNEEWEEEKEDGERETDCDGETLLFISCWKLEKDGEMGERERERER